jgi:hypothetical protein
MRTTPQTLKRLALVVAVAAAVEFVLIAMTSTARTADGTPCGGYWGADDIGTCNADDIRRRANLFGVVALISGGVGGVIALVDRSYRP